MKSKPLTETEEARRGELLVELLHLKSVGRNHPDHGMTPKRYQTEWGTKTPLGLFRMINRIVLDGE
jgi:hypothetical protein